MDVQIKKPKPVWENPELEETLRMLVDAKLSASNIAEALSFETGRDITRSMIMGKVTRMGIKLFGGVGRPMFAQPPMPKKKPEQRAERPPEGVSIPLPPLPAPDADALGSAVPFIERQYNQCCYPLWPHTERTGMVCGKPVTQMTILRCFCPEHYRLCVSPTTFARFEGLR